MRQVAKHTQAIIDGHYNDAFFHQPVRFRAGLKTGAGIQTAAVNPDNYRVILTLTRRVDIEVQAIL